MITHVALMKDGKVYSLPRPNRHHDLIRHMVDVLGIPKPIYGTFGFLDHESTFILRRPAKTIARECGQLLPDEQGKAELYSEDIW